MITYIVLCCGRETTREVNFFRCERCGHTMSKVQFAGLIAQNYRL